MCISCRYSTSISSEVYVVNALVVYAKFLNKKKILNFKEKIIVRVTLIFEVGVAFNSLRMQVHFTI